MQIRDAIDSDVPDLTAINRWAVENTVATFAEQAHDEEERRAWMTGIQSKGHPVLVAEEDGQFLGWASYDQFRPATGYRHTVEHSVYVNPDAQRGGVGTALMNAVIDAARADDEVWTMIATIEGDNVPSIKLHEKLGFTEQGRLPGVGYKFGKRLDLVYMQLEV